MIMHAHRSDSTNTLCPSLVPSVPSGSDYAFTPMPQINAGTVLKYETLANLFSAGFFPCFYLILGYSLYLGI